MSDIQTGDSAQIPQEDSTATIPQSVQVDSTITEPIIISAYSPRQSVDTPSTDFNARTPAQENVHEHPRWVAAFLEALRLNPNITRACRVINIDRSTPYKYREINGDFASAWKEAEAAGADLLEEVAWQRAVEGSLRPIYQGGVKVGDETVYSDSLMIALLKAHKPQKYRERVSAEIKGEVEVFGSIMHTLTDKELIDRAFNLSTEARALSDHSGTGTPQSDSEMEK